MNGSLWATARAVKRITGPRIEPVTVADAQAYCRLPVGEEDTLFARWIRGAREQVETYLGRALLLQTWELVLDAWPTTGPVEVPYPPLVSVTSITTYDATNVSSTCATTVYQVDTWSEPGRIALIDGQSWPSSLRASAAIVIRFVAGYGSDIDSVPAPIQEALLALVAQRARFRGDDDQAPAQWPPMVIDRLAPYRVVSAG